MRVEVSQREKQRVDNASNGSSDGVMAGEINEGLLDREYVEKEAANADYDIGSGEKSASAAGDIPASMQ